ncbi:MAG TPA: response regulator [Vicinamibacterales bacterium]|nr:response regulator [Vicinamibacterales bacterium]
MRSPAEELERLLAPYDCARRGPGRVLIVDDDAGVRSVMTRQLVQAGFDVAAAQSAAEGLAVLRKDGSFRIILLDMLMPKMDGWGFREAQLADPRIASVPAIILTGAPLPMLVHAQLQAADYLLKPVGRDHLVSVVSNYCEPIKVVTRTAAQASSTPEHALGFAQP